MTSSIGLIRISKRILFNIFIRKLGQILKLGQIDRVFTKDHFYGKSILKICTKS